MSKQSRRPGSRDEPRAEPKPTAFEDVASLIKERRKYVDWIAALEAKRDQTPPHVFTRVHADYDERLRAVAARLESHRGSLADQQEGLRKKLEDLDDEIGKHQDERAETELRAHVGELGAAALTEALRAADTEIERLSGAKNSIEADLQRVSEFFAATDAGGSLPPSAPASRTSASGFDELSFLHSVVGAAEPLAKGVDPNLAAAKIAETGELKEADPKPAVTDPAAPTALEPKAVEEQPVPGRTSGAFEPDRQKDQTAAPEPQVTSPTAATGSVEQPSLAAAANPREAVVQKGVELAPVAPPRQSIVMQMASMTIEPSDATMGGGIVKADESVPSLLDGLISSTTPDEKPFAANVASNNPLSLQSTGPGDLKTLKCRECAAMNDPSEWYCERCGAELSAM